MSTSKKRITFETVLHNGPILLILVLGCLLRLYKLDTPSLWYDEILLPQTVSYPFDYFYEWLTTLEVHPPYPYLLVKGIMLVSKSDFALRLLFTAAGCLSIYAVYRVGEKLAGPWVGIWCAALLAVHPWHVYLSRVVRPYAVIILFSTLLLYYTIQYLRKQERTHLIAAAACNALILAFHYDGVFSFATTLSILLLYALATRSRKRLTDSVSFLLFFVIFSLPTVFFLLKAIGIRAGWSHLSTYGRVITQYWVGAVPGLLGNYPGVSFFAWAGLLLLFPGLYVCLKDRKTLLVASCGIFIPFLMLLVLRHGYSLTTWHISYILPVPILVMGLGAARIGQWNRSVNRVALTAFLGVGLGFYATTLSPSFYRENSYAGFYKSYAKAIPSFVRSQEAVLMDPMHFHGSNWYLNQFLQENPLLSQRGDGRQEIVLNILADSNGGLGHLYENEAAMVQDLGAPSESRTFPGMKAYKYALPHALSQAINVLPYASSLNATPKSFYPGVSSFNNVFIYPYWRKLITPVNNLAWSTFDYTIRNNAGNGPQKIQADIAYLNEGVDNEFLASAQFDDEPPLPVLESLTPTPTKGEGNALRHTWSLNRYKPYASLTFHFSMWAALKTPGYNGGNLEKVGFQQLDFTAAPLGSDFFEPAALPFGTATENLAGILSETEPARQWRWALGPQAALRLVLPEDKELELSFACNNPLDGQEVTVLVNGEEKWRSGPIGAQRWMQAEVKQSLTFPGKKGVNTVVFVFAKWNGSPAYFSETDHTPYAVAFTKLQYRILEEHAAAPESGSNQKK